MPTYTISSWRSYMPDLENLKKQAKLILRWHRERHYPVAAQLLFLEFQSAGATFHQTLKRAKPCWLSTSHLRHKEQFAEAALNFCYGRVTGNAYPCRKWGEN